MQKKQLINKGFGFLFEMGTRKTLRRTRKRTCRECESSRGLWDYGGPVTEDIR